MVPTISLVLRAIALVNSLSGAPLVFEVTQLSVTAGSQSADALEQLSPRCGFDASVDTSLDDLSRETTSVPRRARVPSLANWALAVAEDNSSSAPDRSRSGRTYGLKIPSSRCHRMPHHVG
jgi:hypothetical protein